MPWKMTVITWIWIVLTVIIFNRDNLDFHWVYIYILRDADLKDKTQILQIQVYHVNQTNNSYLYADWRHFLDTIVYHRFSASSNKTKSSRTLQLPCSAWTVSVWSSFSSLQSIMTPCYDSISYTDTRSFRLLSIRNDKSLVDGTMLGTSLNRIVDGSNIGFMNGTRSLPHGVWLILRSTLYSTGI